VSVNLIESPYIHWREAKVAGVDETEWPPDAGVVEAASGGGSVGREGMVSVGDEGGNVNSGVERTRSEKKL
jgi:hypothetical protein